MKALLGSILVCIVLAGCASSEKSARVETGKSVDSTVGSNASGTRSSTGPQVSAIERKPAIAVDPLKDPANILSKRSVYFDYDSNLVKDQYRPLVTAHAQYLTQHRSAKVTIQGNTDERGSREYNLALGQRRADSVKQMMVLLGVRETQIESTSFGEEKPKATGKDEASYTENRRDDLVYQGE